jgi:hypothetical protein
LSTGGESADGWVIVPPVSGRPRGVIRSSGAVSRIVGRFRLRSSPDAGEGVQVAGHGDRDVSAQVDDFSVELKGHRGGRGEHLGVDRDTGFKRPVTARATSASNVGRLRWATRITSNRPSLGMPWSDRSSYFAIRSIFAKMRLSTRILCPS